jgi:hypothetical protein
MDGATCSRVRIGEVVSRAGDAAQRTTGDLFVAFRDIGIQCAVSRLAVSTTPPNTPCELNLPLALGPDLVSTLRRASGMAVGLDFTVTHASVGALVHLSENSPGGMPVIDLLSLDVDVSPQHLALSLRDLPLPGADLLASSAVGALLGTWGVAAKLDVLNLGSVLAGVVARAVTEMIAKQVRV